MSVTRVEHEDPLVHFYDPKSPEMGPGYAGTLDESMKTKLSWVKGQLNMEEIATSFVEGLGGMGRDDIILRFLRASKWNEKHALKRIEETMEWRRTFQGSGVASVTKEHVKNEMSSGKTFFCGVDKFGHPLSYIRVRLHDKAKSDPAEMRRFVVWCFEAGRALIRPPAQMCGLVFDMTGFKMSNMDYDFAKFLIETFRDYYPESLGIGLVVGAPFIFKACWAIIKPMMDPVTASKIFFVDKSKLGDYIPKSQLHKDFGGPLDAEPWPEDPPVPGSPEAVALTKAFLEAQRSSDPSARPAIAHDAAAAAAAAAAAPAPADADAPVGGEFAGEGGEEWVEAAAKGTGEDES
jgi:hypothetical protein